MKRVPLKDTDRYTVERFHQLTKADRHAAWLESRRHGVGGSDMGSILGLNSYKTPYALWLEKTGRVEADALRKKRSEAGKRGANRRWDKPENGKNGKPDGKCHGKCHGKPMANAWQTDGKTMANSCPVPVPVPDKKEEENKFSSSKEKINLPSLQSSRELADTNDAITREYPNLDVPAAWNAFLVRHHGENRTIGDWLRQWKGWCQRRAAMSGVPPSKPHTHTWKCSHTLQTLGRSEETAQPDRLALETAGTLNKETR